MAQAPAPGGNQPYYDQLHAYGAGVVCAELSGLPSTNYDAGTNTCPDMPVVVVCVHDGADNGCPSEASPGSGIPAECGELHAPVPQTSQQGTSSRWVEVRACYNA